MLTINSPDSSIRVWLWRVGARLMASSGGLIEVGMAQATVVIFGLLAFPTHEISTVCMGWRSLKAEAMLTWVLADTLTTFVICNHCGCQTYFPFFNLGHCHFRRYC